MKGSELFVAALVCIAVPASLFALLNREFDGQLPVVSVPIAQELSTEARWVGVERLNRRTCPSTDCGIVGQFFYREAIQVWEENNGWARVTDYYSASCLGGRSEYVDVGNSTCSADNGIENGRFAEWVSKEHLTASRPPNPSQGTSGDEQLVAGSDDFMRYRVEFTQAAQALISQRHCTEQDFLNIGGWIKSMNYRDQPVYFTYCESRGSTVQHYLNVRTGTLSQE